MSFKERRKEMSNINGLVKEIIKEEKEKWRK